MTVGFLMKVDGVKVLEMEAMEDCWVAELDFWRLGKKRVGGMEAS